MRWRASLCLCHGKEAGDLHALKVSAVAARGACVPNLERLGSTHPCSRRPAQAGRRAPRPQPAAAHGTGAEATSSSRHGVSVARPPVWKRFLFFFVLLRCTRVRAARAGRRRDASDLAEVPAAAAEVQRQWKAALNVAHPVHHAPGHLVLEQLIVAHVGPRRLAKQRGPVSAERQARGAMRGRRRESGGEGEGEGEKRRERRESEGQRHRRTARFRWATLAARSKTAAACAACVASLRRATTALITASSHWQGDTGERQRL